MKSKYQFIVFSFSGTLGLIIDITVLFYSSLYLNLYISRIISFLFAVVVTWILNRNLTFKQKDNYLPRYLSDLANEFKRYFLASLIGGVINLSIYFLYIYINNDSLDKYIATILGGLAGLISNFIFSKFIIFKK